MTGLGNGTEHISKYADAANLKEYRSLLETRAYKDRTVDSKIKHIVRCVKEITSDGSDPVVSEIGIQHFHTIKEHLKDHTIGYIRANCYDFGEFIAEICSDMNLEVLSRLDGPVKLQDIDLMYANELESFRDSMRSKGEIAGCIEQQVNHVRICMLALIDRYGWMPVEKITVPHMRFVYDNLPLSRVVGQLYLPSFGRFIESVTGTNLFLEYREFRSGDRFERRVEELDFAEELRSYLSWQERRGSRKATIDTIASSLMVVFTHMREQFGRCDKMLLDEIDPELLYLFRDRLTDLRESTKRKMLGDLGGFLEWYTGDNPYLDAKMLWSNGEVRRTWIDKAQWSTILDSADVTMRLACLLAGTIGLRVSEIAGLRVEDIQGDIVTIRGKGHGVNGKVVRKRMLGPLKEAMERYMEFRRSVIGKWGDVSKGMLLITKDKGVPLTNRMLMNRLRQISKATGIDFSFHTLRRYYAMCIYDTNKDPNVIRIMMRHECIDTTYRCYLHADPRVIADVESKLEEALFA